MKLTDQFTCNSNCSIVNSNSRIHSTILIYYSVEIIQTSFFMSSYIGSQYMCLITDYYHISKNVAFYPFLIVLFKNLLTLLDFILLTATLTVTLDLRTRYLLSEHYFIDDLFDNFVNANRFDKPE